MSEAKVFRWGIISTGWIADKFVTDLLVDPKTRGVHDIIHKVVAVGSRTVEKAQGFIDKSLGGDKSIKAFANYSEVYADKDVDAIYIGTPHSEHYTNALEAIRAGKHVLCEKPVTLNTAELVSLIAEAKARDVFFMEAMWTRFQPLPVEIKRILDSGELGRPLVIHADFSVDFGIDKLSLEHRILNPQLGGGGLLDLGPYPLIWAILALYEHPDNDKKAPVSITATAIKTQSTNVDQNTSFTLNFFNDSVNPPFQAQAVLSCNINVPDPAVAAIIRCEKGTINIDAPLPVPAGYTINYRKEDKKEDVRKEFKYDGFGWHFQADEVARAVWQGKKETDLWGHEKSLVEMRIFDEVRRQIGYALPKGVEKVL